MTIKALFTCCDTAGKRQRRNLKASQHFIFSHRSVCVRVCVCVCGVCVCLVAQLCLTLCDPMDYSPPGYLCSWGVSRQEYCSGLPCLSPGDLPKQTRSSQPQAHYSCPQALFPPGPSSLFRLHPACRTRLHKGPLHQPGQRWSQPPLQPGPWGPPASISLTV